MNNKTNYFMQGLFLIVNLISGVYYSPFYIGQSKAYVAWFGMVSVLVVLIAAIVFIIDVVKRRHSRFLIALYGLVCIMQFFPMVGALILSPAFRLYAVFHMIILLIGLCCVYLSLKNAKGR